MRPGAVPPPDCPRCPRLVALREQVRARHPDYHAAPVPGIGAAKARLLVVGLAPGLHGANASGWPFAGDGSGALLYAALRAHGFANEADPDRAPDRLALYDCRVTNVVKCLPPENRPVAEEVRRCSLFLEQELAGIELVIALGGVAHRALVRLHGRRQADLPFVHNRLHVLASPERHRGLLDSYHCSRYNLNTRRLTPAMFDAVFARARAILDRG